MLVMLVMSLDRNEKAFTVTEISNLSQATLAGVTCLINPLEEAAYVERWQDPNDRRIIRIGLTDKGIQVAARRSGISPVMARNYH